MRILKALSLSSTIIKALLFRNSQTSRHSAHFYFRHKRHKRMALLPMPILFYALLFAQLRQKKKEANMQGRLQHTAAINELLCLKYAGAQISLFFTSYE